VVGSAYATVSAPIRPVICDVGVSRTRVSGPSDGNRRRALLLICIATYLTT